MRILVTMFLASLLIVAAGCNPKPVRREVSRSGERTRITSISKDTVAYLIEFVDRTDRDRFLSTFRNFLRQYPFAAVRSDSGSQYVVVRILPLQDSDASADTLSFSAVDQSSFIEDVIERSAAALDSSGIAPDTVKTRTGGNARLYLDRGLLDNTFSTLVRSYPFSRQGQDVDSIMPYLTVVDSSHRRIVLRIEGKVTNCAGQVLSALDFIDQWTGLIRNNPAEGIALFRHVDGVMAFIKGEEAVIRGFNATDGKTIQIRMANPDPEALNRIRSSRLLWSGFRIGPYCIRASRDNELSLGRNDQATQSAKVLLDQLAIRMGGENNPILSFSLGKFDAMTVTSSGDLEYARRNLGKSSTLTPVSRDRYFISCNLPDRTARAFVESIIDPADLLRNFVKAEGKPIQALETETVHNDTIVAEGAVQRPLGKDPVKIMYRSDDPVSKIIAEKLMADLTHAGLPCALKAYDQKRYESSLVMRDYGCAVGWAPESVLYDTSERLRLSAIWFADQTDEQIRLREHHEIPLFSIDRYLLLKNNLHLYQGRLSGICFKQE